MDMSGTVRWECGHGWPVPRGVLRHGRFSAVVEVLDRWAEAGRWWEGEEAESLFFRVQLADGSVRQVPWPTSPA